MPLVVDANEFTQPDYTIWYTANDGRRLAVGRIFRASADTPQEALWFWSVEIDRRGGRTPPHQGYAADEGNAAREWKTLLGVRRRADQLVLTHHPSYQRACSDGGLNGASKSKDPGAGARRGLAWWKYRRLLGGNSEGRNFMMIARLMPRQFFGQ